MIARDQLPDDAADWSAIAIDLPRLKVDAASSCPRSPAEVFEYVQTESADVDNADRSRLEFRRTAQVAGSQFWLWKYTEEDGEIDFVTYRVNADGSTCLGLANPNCLSEEQYILAEYYDEVYWS